MTKMNISSSVNWLRRKLFNTGDERKGDSLNNSHQLESLEDGVSDVNVVSKKNATK